MFRAKQYRTAAFIGNWALRPQRKLNRGFETYTRDFKNSEGVRDHPENRAKPLTDQAIDWLKHRDDDEPFFLWLHLQEPHGSYEPPSFDKPTGRSEGGVEPLVLPKGKNNSGKNAIPKYQWLGHGRLDEYEARYDGEVTEADRHIGRLLETLRSLDLLDESVILFTSDHGEAFGEDEIYCAHGTGLGEALLHVPMLLRIPGHGAQTRADRVRLIDIVPTVAELFELEPPPLRGRSLLRDEGDRTVIAQIGIRPGERWRSIQIGDQRIHEKWQGEYLESGFDTPAEAGSEQALQTRDHALELLERFAPWPLRQKAPTLSKEDRDALRALGYIE